MPRPIRPAILDIEASGFGPHSYPIEVGYILENGTRYSALITPEPHWQHWSSEAEAIHGISREQLAVHGRPVTEVATQLNRQLQGLTLYSDGWVVDKPWLITLFTAAGIAPRFALSALEMIMDEAQMAHWHPIKDQLTRQHADQRHRASQDAWIIQETYYRTRQLSYPALKPACNL